MTFTTTSSEKKILLMLLPFWVPYFPPLGISSLKSYLESNEFKVKCVDLNVESELWNIHKKYIDYLSNTIQENKKGNIYTIGYNLITFHSLAFLNKDTEKDYMGLLKELVFKLFLFEMDDSDINVLDELMSEYYFHLDKSLDNILKNDSPDVLGLSLYNANIASSLFALRKYKKINPKGKTVLGGGVFADQLHPDSDNFKLLLEQNSDVIDKVIVGEGEELLLKLLKNELPEKQKVFTIRDVNNCYADLEKATIPNFDDFNIDKYPQLASYASRSCYYQCKFCSETEQWGKFRKKSVEKISSEMEELSEKYNRNLYLFGDSLLDPVIGDLSQELIFSGATVYFDGYLRVSKEACDYDTVSMYRSAGFYRARLGIESGSEKILKCMDKRIDRDMIKNTVKNLAKAGIKTTAYFVCGFPGETKEDFDETLSLIEELSDYIYSTECHPFWFYPKGQPNSDQWIKEYGIEPIFSEELAKLISLQTWRIKVDPKQEEVLTRLYNFNNLCKELKIPNPYSLTELHSADERWKKLHENAVPSILELQ